MARSIYRYQPINLFPDRTIGIKLPFNRSVAGNDSRTAIDSYSGTTNGGGLFSLSKTTEEQSTSNFINLILTETGERIMQPNFGTNLRRVLFNQNTDSLANAVDDVIRTAVALWLPYIELVNVEIDRDPDRYIFSVKIVYRVTNFPAERVINVLLSENVIQIAPQETLPGVTRLTPVGTYIGYV